MYIFFVIASYNGVAQSNDINKNFSFGKRQCKASEVIIDKPILYNDEVGYGFDYQSVENVVFNKKSITGEKSIYFSVKLPEGNYKVDVVLRGKKSSTTTIKAESRRLMLKEQKLDKKETFKYSFVVNVRTPRIDGANKINIKDREKYYLNWDDKLTLEFLGNPIIQSLKISSVSSIKTVFLAGDSTVTDQDLEPWASWGQFFTNYFTKDVVITNYAVSGSSLSSFKSRKRLEKIISVMQAGDYLFIEFGHNDEKIKGEGNGAWGLYTNLLKEFITKARNKGGIPVLVTPTQRRAFNSDGTLKPTHGDFPDAMRKVAADLQVPLIDVTKMTTNMYESWGAETSRKAFVQYPANTFPGQKKELKDNTHFNSFGANEIAKCVIQGIRDLDLEIAKYIKENTPSYNPNNPDNLTDWTVPMSLRFENTKPDGN
ncbi:rhamnogalacturonan acetylesterase [Thalassobellus citreus]|uniref:rhamnogalacturonan acetylesterase n=1 Tax=Thalassobellus citreus TaxID=3367752 RepID=UPI0037ACF93E